MEHFGQVYHNSTTLHPLALVMLTLLGGLLFIVPRDRAIYPILFMSCFVAMAQRIVVAGLDFDMLRMMILFGWLRVFWRGEFRDFQWRGMDFAIIIWAAVGIVAYTALRGTPGALIFRCGLAFDQLGLYFLFRFLIKTWDDLDKAIIAFVWVSVPLAIAFTAEKVTGHNIFAHFGGVPYITVERDGRLRCRGAFPHPIIAGVFWSTLVPLVASRIFHPDRRYLVSILGVICCLVLVFCVASSTPVMALGFSFMGAVMFIFRGRLGELRWMVVGSLVVIHFLYDKPVWHLISRIDLLGGTGWHRYFLIDQAIRRFEEWALFGTISTANWGGGLFDITNHYIFEGVYGGFGALVMFVVIIVLAFQYVGRLWRSSQTSYHLATSWALGVSMFAHCMIFISVSYFGQVKIVWFFHLAAIASLSPLPVPSYAAVRARLQRRRQLALSER